MLISSLQIYPDISHLYRILKQFCASWPFILSPSSTRSFTRSLDLLYLWSVFCHFSSKSENALYVTWSIRSERLLYFMSRYVKVKAKPGPGVASRDWEVVTWDWTNHPEYDSQLLSNSFTNAMCVVSWEFYTMLPTAKRREADFPQTKIGLFQ